MSVYQDAFYQTFTTKDLDQYFQELLFSQTFESSFASPEQKQNFLWSLDDSIDDNIRYNHAANFTFDFQDRS